MCLIIQSRAGIEPAGRGAPKDMSPCLRTGECRRRAPGMQARRREIPAGWG